MNDAFSIVKILGLTETRYFWVTVKNVYGRYRRAVTEGYKLSYKFYHFSLGGFKQKQYPRIVITPCAKILHRKKPTDFSLSLLPGAVFTGTKSITVAITFSVAT